MTLSWLASTFLAYVPVLKKTLGKTPTNSKVTHAYRSLDVRKLWRVSHCTQPVLSVHICVLPPVSRSPGAGRSLLYIWRLLSRQNVFTSVSERINDCVIFLPVWFLPELCIYFIILFFCYILLYNLIFFAVTPGCGKVGKWNYYYSLKSKTNK